MSFALKLPFLNDHFLFANKHSSLRKFQRSRNLSRNPYQGQITVKILLKKIVSDICQPRKFIKDSYFRASYWGQLPRMHSKVVISINRHFRYTSIWSCSLPNSFNLGQTSQMLSKAVISISRHFRDPSTWDHQTSDSSEIHQFEVVPFRFQSIWGISLQKTL